MACDVTITRLDKDEVIKVSVDGSTTLDDLMVRVASHCNISPIVTTLFSFRQVIFNFLP